MYTIQALRNFYVDFPVPGLAMYFQEKIDQTVGIAGYVWLVRGEGKTIVVDAGIGRPPEVGGSGKQMVAHFTIDAGEDTTSLLRRESVSPEQVDWLILTHLHTDHCLNTPLFKNARIVVSRRGWNAITNPAHSSLYLERVFSREVLDYLRAAGDRVVFADDEQQILPGISVFHTGGHTPCSQAVCIETSAGKAVITGDVVSLYGHIEENIPVAYCHDLLECYRAMDRIRREADIILPTHDPDVMVRHPGGRIG